LLKKIFFLCFIAISFSIPSETVFSQDILSKDYFKKNGLSLNKKINVNKDDTSKTISGRSKVKKVNIGGIFISPYIGFGIPIGSFGDQSNAGFLYGFKAELAYNKLYPFVFGFIYENQSFPGNPEFTTENSLTDFTTDMTNIGGSLDILLNKYIRSNFTSAIFSLEVKYAKVTRSISSNVVIPEGLPGDVNLITYSAGLGVTIYIFDLGARYTFAKDMKNLSFQMRIHFPLVKF